MTSKRPDVEQVMSGLKDFQRHTVDHAFHQLYEIEESTGRFLVADEVGLGKTLVAKGLVSKVIDYLWDTVDRIDVVYICSNADIARQNAQRLRLGDGVEPEMATRVTMLPVTISNLRCNKVNFISLTPGTSFDLKSSLGTKDERSLLYLMLSEAWGLRGKRMLKLLQGDADLDNFRECIRWYEGKHIDPDLKQAFIDAVNWEQWENPDGETVPLRDAFETMMSRFKVKRWEDRRQRNLLVGRLRMILAQSCLRSLEPDFIILDEFQRFKHLFDPDNEAGLLAQALFGYTPENGLTTRLLLLSATPYKMYSLHSESANEDHYKDFIDTVRFLLKDEEKGKQLEQGIQLFRDEVFRLGADPLALQRLRETKAQIEGILKSVMARTERLSISEDRNGMLTQIVGTDLRLEPGDLRDYLLMQAVAEALESGDTLEYWKTAPYLLNFMDGYQLKNALLIAAEENPRKASQVVTALHRNRDTLWPYTKWNRYKSIDAKNPRMRQLVTETVDNDAWRLLWLPPTLPYYQLAGAFHGTEGRITKRLIFSSWRVVPKAIASILSYEVERRMITSFERAPENSPEARRRRRGLLNFAVSDGRTTGMPVISLMYPCSTFIRMFDPLLLASEHQADVDDASLPLAEQTLRMVSIRIQALLDEVFGPDERTDPLPDETWYWAAPILLDLHFDPSTTSQWWGRNDLPQLWSSGGEADDDSDGDNTRWNDHVNRVRELITNAQGHRMGRRPPDLARMLALMALAAPGVTALRSLCRNYPPADSKEQRESMDTAANIGWSFRNLFNVPEFTLMIRGMNGEEPYWMCVLEYCFDGCLQAVIDEYIHCVSESMSLVSKLRVNALDELAGSFRHALSLRTTRLAADNIQVNSDRLSIEKNAIGMRARFAQRFGNEQSDGAAGGTIRSTQVRHAFNSPFWPFVLTTTSIGQEGLDFHTYCHSVEHWDLPSNPVDLEQREGRVHRYKGHAIRKNVALRHGTNMLERVKGHSGAEGLTDPWSLLFQLAVDAKPEGESELVPYWVYPVEGGAKIERHVPALPMSRDLEKLTMLRKTLAVYRMVFGQPRQDDLIEYLLRVYGPEEVAAVSDELRIDLSPLA